MIEFLDLELEIQGAHILNGVSFSVNEGKTVGLIGPNGSGKTTLFNCVSGFYFPQKGSINYKGASITNLSPHKRSALGLGRVFQSAGVFREMTLLENVVVALEARQKPLATFLPWSQQNKVNQEKARHYLGEVGLEVKANQKASSLSGGQLRLLEIIRTLAFGAELFLLDEPTAGVSPKMKDEVAKLIMKLQELKKTILIIEHDINFIQKFCERVVVLDQGRVVIDGTPQEVRNNEMLQEIYFGASEV